MKIVVLYYSRTRKTALAAKTLAKGVGADIIEFMDLKDRMGPLNYMGATIDALRENKTQIKPDSADISEYGLVYIGTPTWGGKPAPAVITLIDRCDLQGKDVILFTTMSGKGGESVIKRMREKAEARGGRMVNSFVIPTSNKSSDEIREYVESVVEKQDLTLYGI